VGQTLTATTGTWTNNPTSFTYQWNRAGTAISGATRSSYVPVTADIGNTLTVYVTAANTGGSSTLATSLPTVAVAAAGSLVISGTAQVGQTLTASGGSGGYQWYHEGSAISGATTSTHTLQGGDLGDLISVLSGGVFSALAGPVIGTTVFYVSSSTGSDSNPGTFSQPWKTLAHVNAQTFSAGTSVLFKRGDTWRTDGNSPYSLGAALIPKSSGTSGNPIVFDAYGIGANPIIDGSWDGSATGSWTSTGTTNVWKSVQTFKPASFATVTFIGSNANVTTSYGLSVGQAFVFYGTLPSNLSLSTTYYIKSVSSSTFQFSLTPTGTAITPNASGSATLGGNGYPYDQANDPSNILWGFSLKGGTNVAPAITNASTGPMVGGGAGGVWYNPGDGTAGLTTQGQWNFNTDNWTVQVYSVGNPATVMTGLSIAIDTACLFIKAQSYITFQNITIQYCGASPIMSVGANNSIIIRDSVQQWSGGGNNGGQSTLNSRYGDAIDLEGTTTGWLVERCWFHEMYDVGFGPQCGVPGPQNNIICRNCVSTNLTALYVTFPIGGTPPTNVINCSVYNNTSFDNGGSWSCNPVVQRPNGAPNAIGVSLGMLTQTGLSIENNIFAAIGGVAGNPGFGVDGTPWTSASNPANPFTGSGVWLDYNCWPINTESSSAQQIALPSANYVLQSWATGTSAAGSFSPALEVHGIFGQDPQFTSQSGLNFSPASGSPCRNAGVNRYSQGVVWDITKKPRPASGPFTIGAFQ